MRSPRSLHRKHGSRPKPPAKPPAKALGRQMDRLLQERWRRCDSLFQRCQRGLSRKSVHRLRQEIRGLLVHFELLEALIPNNALGPARHILKKKLKPLGELRDSQGQLRRVGRALPAHPELKPFHKYLRKRKRRLARSAAKALKGAKLSKIMTDVSQYLRHALGGVEGNRPWTILNQSIRQAAERVIRQQPQTDTSSRAMHRARIAFKKYTDMVNALQPVLIRMSAGRLSRMHAHQALMGDIHDLDLLMARLDKFVAKKKSAAKRSSAFRSALADRRLELLIAYYESADRLFPVRPGHAIAVDHPSHALPGNPHENQD